MSWRRPLSLPPFLLPPLLPSIFPFVFFSHPHGRFHLFPSPCPAEHSIEMASRPHTNPRLLAQASHIPWATSYLRFDYGRPPSRTNVLLCCLSALYPDVAQIIKGKLVSSTGVITTSVADAARKCSSIIIAALVPEKKKRRRIEPDMHTQPVGRAHIYFKHTEAIFRGWYKDYILNSINPSGNKKKKICTIQKLRAKGSAANAHAHLHRTR